MEISEEYTKKELEMLGYNVKLGKNTEWSEAGIPDFFVSFGADQFWVEVKTEENVGLNYSQFEWILKNLHLRVYLAIVKGNHHPTFVSFYKILIHEIKTFG